MEWYRIHQTHGFRSSRPPLSSLLCYICSKTSSSQISLLSSTLPPVGFSLLVLKCLYCSGFPSMSGPYPGCDPLCQPHSWGGTVRALGFFLLQKDEGNHSSVLPSFVLILSQQRRFHFEFSSWTGWVPLFQYHRPVHIPLDQ